MDTQYRMGYNITMKLANGVIGSVILFQLTSCLSIEAKNSSRMQKQPAVPVNVPAIVEAPKEVVSEPTCVDCIKGVAEIDDEMKVTRKSYFLYGAEHLNLKNNYFDIPVVYNKDVKRWISFFLNRGKNYFIRYSERAGRYVPLMGKMLEDAGLPRDLIFLAMAESGFHNKAKSWAKAVGPWQFMPYTGKKFGLQIDWYVDERRDPIKATVAAANYLSVLYNRFGTWELAAAAYNAGEGKVGRAIRRYKTENFWKIKKGRYLKSETKNYVPKIMALAIIGKNLESFGFKEIDFHEPLDFEEVKVPNNTDLVALSEKIGVPFEEIQRLNPELLRWQTPPNVEEYSLRVPPGMKQIYAQCCSTEDFSASKYQSYALRSNTNLKAVARKFKIKKPAVLSWINGNMSVNKRMRRGTVVKLPFRTGQSNKAPMYADLYERPRKSVRIRRTYRKYINTAKRKGKLISNPKAYYVVRKGDSLWSVSKKTGQSIYTIIRSNLGILSRRQLMPGDKLAVR